MKKIRSILIMISLGIMPFIMSEANGKIFHGGSGRVYSSGPDEKQYEIDVYRDYIFQHESVTLPLTISDLNLKIYPNHTYVAYAIDFTTFLNERVNHSGKWGDLESGYWSVKSDTIFFYEMTSIYYIYEEYEFIEYSRIKPDCTRIGYVDYATDGRRPLNVSVGIIKDFGARIEVLKDEPGGKAPNSIRSSMYYIPYACPDIAVRFNSYDGFERRINQTPYFPWCPTKVYWQGGIFDVEAIGGYDSGGRHVILKKNGLRFTVVDPRCYLPGSGLKLYDPADVDELSKWMQKVRVGESYEFELMRPAYPADSIADFPPLQTVADSIYAAEGEAYGYFFARLKK